jgi:hypothetical protein
MFLAGAWERGQTLEDAWDFLREAVRAHRADFEAYLVLDHAETAAEARRLSTCLRRASAADVRCAVTC